MPRFDPATGAVLRALVALARADGAALLGHHREPHDELLSLLWCRQFDRGHALRLLAQADGPPRPGLAARLLAAADLFDHLGADAQQRLCDLVARHRRLACAPQSRTCHAFC